MRQRGVTNDRVNSQIFLPRRMVWQAIFLFFGIAIGWYLNASRNRVAGVGACEVHPVRQGGFDLINPLLACDLSVRKEISEFQSLEDEISGFVGDQKKAHALTKMSVYFHDPSTGQWSSVGPAERYSPASLLKVPTMIAYFKLAESNPGILLKRFTYDGGPDYNAGEFYHSTQVIKPGMSYTVEELIKALIVGSDNNAARLLIQNVDARVLQEVYTDLGLSVPPDPTQGSVDFIATKDYLYFFRVLYNATYLSREMSEKALALLVQADFPSGLVSGIPSGVKSATKFGERTLHYEDGSPDIKELHDCGIIYYPRHPYQLCVMTQGYDFAVLAGLIQHVSRMVWAEVDSRYQ